MRPILMMTSLCASMSLERKDSSQKSKELVFILAIAGRIDAQSRLLAQKLDKSQYIYHSYAILDSLSSSYSMFKYFVEVLLPNDDPDFLHDLLTTPGGIAAFASEALFLVSFSFLASVYDKEKTNSYKKFIASSWPYLRDVLKGLKNAYKGWRSTLQVVGLINGADLKYLLIPAGVLLGVFAAANRFWIRGVVESRKQKMNTNIELLLEIQQLNPLTPLDRNDYLSRIAYQSDKERRRTFLAVAAGGFIDGLYLYVGVVSLSMLAPPLLLAMSILSAFYTLSCVVTRIYEEYDFQLRLMVTQTKCKLELVKKELEATYPTLLALTKKESKTEEEILEIKRLQKEIAKLLGDFETLRQTLKSQTTYSYLTAGLLGMKYGLYAYGLLTSILFMVSTIFLVTATVFPPSLLAVFICSGLVFMAGFTAYTLRAHYYHLQKQKKVEQDEHLYDQLLEMKKAIESEAQEEIATLSSEHFGLSVKDGLALDPSPQFFFQEWFEVFRSLASGLSKGKNFSNFAAISLQESDLEGHYQDTSVMGTLAIVNAVLFSLVLSLRALARGLGRPPLAAPINSSDIKQVDPKESPKGARETEAAGESSEQSKIKAPDSLPKSSSASIFSFFSPKPSSQSVNKTFFDSKDDSESDLSNEHTILGLE